MSGDHVTRPEFDIYVKMTAEAIATIAKSTEESLAESRETNQILREHTIHNNNKHDKSNERITAIAKEIEKNKKSTQKEIKDIKETLSEREGFYSIAKLLKRGAVIIIGGALVAYGGLLATDYHNKNNEEKPKAETKE